MHFGNLKSRTNRARATCERVDDDGAMVVRVAGELDHEGVLAVENDVRWAVANAVGTVVIDAGSVTFVDSAGLRLLLQSQMMAADRHLRFLLANPADSLVRLLELTGLEDLIETGDFA